MNVSPCFRAWDVVVCVCVFIVWVGNGAGPDAPGGGADSETDINLEVSFSEQALIYKEGLKVTQLQNEADDRLPVSQTFTHQVNTWLAAWGLRNVNVYMVMSVTETFDLTEYV